MTGEFDRWLKKWRRNEKYSTQVLVLETVIGAALRGVEGQLATVSPRGTAADVYRDCARVDHAALWARRVWEYYRTKFDQRGDPTLGATLAAADEVAWSCYKEAFDRAAATEPTVRRTTAPLPFVDDLYAPQAFVRDEPPPGLRVPAEVEPQMRAAMDDFLRRLPVPVVALPASCVGAPWWLSLLAHEVGHHVENDLLPEGRLMGTFATAVHDAAEGARSGAGVRWRAWGSEIFADAFSLGMIGPAATWAMTELEFGDAVRMLRPSARYPAPMVRLALMTALEQGLDVSDLSAAAPLDSAALASGEPLIQAGRDLREAARDDLACVDVVAATAWTAELVGGETLPVLCGWSADAFRNNVRDWTAGLLGRKGLHPDRSLEAARHLAAATVLAFVEVASQPDEARRREMTCALAERALDAFPRSGEEGTRAAEASPAWHVRERANELVNLLLHPPSTQHE